MSTKIKYHIIFWLLYWVTQSLLMSEGKNVHFYLTKNVAMVSIQAFVVYFNLLFLVPRFFQTKKYIIYIICGIILILFLYTFSFQWIEVVILIFSNFISGLIPIEFPPIALPKSFWEFLSGSAPYSLAFVTSALYFINEQNSKNKQIALKLKLEKINTEMLYLRSQINPHFLFNSLNNIHGLIHSQPDIAETYLLKLGDLLRHMLYEVRKDKTKLTNEINAVKDYFQLMEIRSGKSIPVNISLASDEAEIIPLILCSLMENAVKHSGLEFDDSADIEVWINEVNLILSVKVINSISKMKNKSTHEGIGINNVKKRLQLNYVNKYSFDLTLENHLATTKLKINL